MPGADAKKYLNEQSRICFTKETVLKTNGNRWFGSNLAIAPTKKRSITHYMSLQNELLGMADSAMWVASGQIGWSLSSYLTWRVNAQASCTLVSKHAHRFTV